MPGPPIVLILFDQLRADAIGAAGHPHARTPHLDVFARDAVRFETCITSAPLCRPARIGLLTGLPATAHGFDSNRHVPEPGSLPSHVRDLRDAGYRTMVVGKTHLHRGGGHLDAHRDRLEAWGYTDAVELGDAQMHHLESAYTDWLTRTTPPGEASKLDRWRDHVAHHHPLADPPDAAPWHLSTDDHHDVFCARQAAQAIADHRGDRPLYLQVCFPGPHPPFDPPAEHLPAADPPPPIPRAHTGPTSPVELRYRRAQRGWSAEAVARARRAYVGKVSLVDRAFGEVLAALHETGLSDSAWIVITSDHGELLGDHGLFGKVLPYESSIRIPLIVRPPAGTAPRTDSTITELVDVTATLRDLAGLAPEGRSLCERVLSPPTVPEPRDVPFAAMGYLGLRTSALTMTWDRATGRPLELYDRRDDPDQHHNRVQDPRYRAALDEGWSALAPQRAVASSTSR